MTYYVSAHSEWFNLSVLFRPILCRDKIEETNLLFPTLFRCIVRACFLKNDAERFSLTHGNTCINEHCIEVTKRQTVSPVDNEFVTDILPRQTDKSFVNVDFSEYRFPRLNCNVLRHFGDKKCSLFS